MTVSVGNQTNVGYSGDHINNGNCVIYLVGASNGDGVTATITSATYGGVAMTKETSATQSYGANDKGAVALFRLLNPAQGSNTAAATVSGANVAWGYCISLAGIKTADTLKASNGDQVTSAALDTMIGGIAIGCIESRTNGHSPLSDVIEDYDGWNGGYGHAFAVCHILATGASMTVGWSSVTCCNAFASYNTPLVGPQFLILS